MLDILKGSIDFDKLGEGAEDAFAAEITSAEI